MEATPLISPLLNEWLGLMIDVALIVGVFCLWLTWHRNGKRQQKMEQLLIVTAKQLEEASMHLSLATHAIEQLQQQEKSIVNKPPVSPPVSIQEPAAAVAVSMSAQNQHEPVRLPAQNSTQATMILRMQREGESETAIADRLDIPLAQVKLMLKLHTASNSTPQPNSISL